MAGEVTRLGLVGIPRMLNSSFAGKTPADLPTLTIDGATTKVISTAHGSIRLYTGLPGRYFTW